MCLRGKVHPLAVYSDLRVHGLSVTWCSDTGSAHRYLGIVTVVIVKLPYATDASRAYFNLIASPISIMSEKSHVFCLNAHILQAICRCSLRSIPSKGEIQYKV